MDAPIGKSGSDILAGFASQKLRLARRLSDVGVPGARFLSESVGPSFESEAALRSYYDACHPGLMAEPFVSAQCRFLKRQSQKPLKPTYETGKRWPDAPSAPQSHWVLILTYWNIAEKTVVTPPPVQARKLRKKADATALSADVVKSLTDQGLKPLMPQKALDIGLFEIRAPENPDLILPDE